MMNLKIICSVLIITLGLMTLSCNDTVHAPLLVLQEFTLKFPEVKEVEWHKESEKTWEAEFLQNGMEYSANFLEDGTWQETEHEIKVKELPKNILDQIRTSFSGFKIEGVEISETSEGSTYEIEIEKRQEKYELKVDFEGNILNSAIKNNNGSG